MVAALTCGDTARVNFNAFKTRFGPDLRVSDQLMLRMFGRAGHPTPLGQAFAEYGRIDKTMHLLAVVDPVDDTYRRTMNR